MKKFIKNLLIFSILLICSYSAEARKFYFSAAGNDAYTTTQAQNSSTPWKTLAKLQSFATSGAAAGDTFAFRCGDVFIGPYDRYGSIQWGSPFNGAPSGTALNPIVFTNYGTGEKPNFLFPTPSNIQGNARIVFAFDRSNYIIFDGIQFNDTRFPANDKVSTAYTKTGILVGEEGASSNNIIIKNCTFNNIGCGIEAAGNNITIYNNIFTNLKNFGDTATMADIGCVPMSLASGKYYVVQRNYIKGGWGFSGATASGQGLNGTGIELVNDIDSSYFIYNTIIDCAGAIEYGNITGNTSIGADNNIFAYNKFINNGNIAYLGVGSTVSSKFRFWNNVYVENQYSRFTGPRFGTDIYGDGQSFSGFPSWPTWPKNPTTANFGGFRAIQYPTEATTVSDTLIDSKNNIFWLTTGLQAIYTTVSRPKYFHRNNVYRLAGANTVLGGTLTGTERIINTKIYIDTTSIYPENWNFYPLDTSYANTNGVSTEFRTDFSGTNIVGQTPFIGILKTQAATPTCSFTYSTWSACTNGQQTRVATGTPTGCTGTPPVDSLVRTCTVACTSFTYSAWSSCVNGSQTRTYTASPQGCVGTPPVDSTYRTCVTPPTPCTTTLTLLSVRSASCYNTLDGYITVGANCVTGSILYSLTNTTTNVTVSAVTTATQYTFSNVKAGTYNVTIRDSNNKTSSVRVTVRARRARNC